MLFVTNLTRDRRSLMAGDYSGEGSGTSTLVVAG